MQLFAVYYWTALQNFNNLILKHFGGGDNDVCLLSL